MENENNKNKNIKKNFNNKGANNNELYSSNIKSLSNCDNIKSLPSENLFIKNNFDDRDKNFSFEEINKIKNVKEKNEKFQINSFRKLLYSWFYYIPIFKNRNILIYEKFSDITKKLLNVNMLMKNRLDMEFINKLVFTEDQSKIIRFFENNIFSDVSDFTFNNDNIIEIFDISNKLNLSTNSIDNRFEWNCL